MLMFHSIAASLDYRRVTWLASRLPARPMPQVGNDQPVISALNGVGVAFGEGGFELPGRVHSAFQGRRYELG